MADENQCRDECADDAKTMQQTGDAIDTDKSIDSRNKACQVSMDGDKHIDPII